MSVRILYFGVIADIVGKRQSEFNLSDETTVKTIVDQIITEYPFLSRHTLLLAVNQQYASGEEILKDEDELAIFTAVSGG